jgi:hypothetical protein
MTIDLHTLNLTITVINLVLCPLVVVCFCQTLVYRIRAKKELVQITAARASWGQLLSKTTCAQNAEAESLPVNRLRGACWEFNFAAKHEVEGAKINGLRDAVEFIPELVYRRLIDADSAVLLEKYLPQLTVADHELRLKYDEDRRASYLDRPSQSLLPQ